MFRSGGLRFVKVGVWFASLLTFLQKSAPSAVQTVVPARGKALIQTDLKIAVPQGIASLSERSQCACSRVSPGTYGRVAPRSGLAWKHSIDVGAGVIDADYRGNGKRQRCVRFGIGRPRSLSFTVGVILFNHSDEDFKGRWSYKISECPT